MREICNYADDFVICCRPGNAEAAMTRMARVMTRLGLEVNTNKTRIARLPEEQFDFLGYTVGRFHGKDGRPYFGTRPSRKAVKSSLAPADVCSGRRMTGRSAWRSWELLLHPRPEGADFCRSAAFSLKLCHCHAVVHAECHGDTQLRE